VGEFFEKKNLSDFPSINDRPAFCREIENRESVTT